MSTIGFWVTLRPKKDNFEEIKRRLFEIQERTHQETGCTKYEIYESPDKTALHLLESYIDEEAFRFHKAQTYTIDFKQHLQSALAEPMQWIEWRDCLDQKEKNEKLKNSRAESIDHGRL